MLPLTNANLLAHAIVGSVLENLDMERLIREVGYAVAEKIHLNNESVDDVARELHEKLLLRNESTKHIVIENIYRDIPEAAHNIQVWLTAASVQEAKPQLKRVRAYTETVRDAADLAYRSTALASPRSISHNGICPAADIYRLLHEAACPWYLPCQALLERPSRATPKCLAVYRAAISASPEPPCRSPHSVWLVTRLHLAP